MSDVEKALCVIIDYACGTRMNDALVRNALNAAHFRRILKENRACLTAYEYAQQRRLEAFMKS